MFTFTLPRGCALGRHKGRPLHEGGAYYHRGKGPYDLSTPKSYHFWVIPFAKFEHFGSFVFERQTDMDAQTDGDEHITPMTVIGVSNKWITRTAGRN